MTNKKMAKPATAKPVIYVHAKGRGPIDKHSVQKLLQLGLPVCSRVNHEGLKYDGLTQTENGYDQPALLIAELAGLFPGRPIIIQRAGLQPSVELVDQLIELLDHARQPLALSVLSNAETVVNPFAGLQAPVLTEKNETEKNDTGKHDTGKFDTGKFGTEELGTEEFGTEVSGTGKYDFGGLVSLLAPGQMHTLTAWTDHFVLLSADLVTRLATDNPAGTLMQQLASAGAELRLADHLFLHDPDKPVIRPLDLKPWETVYPPPFSELSSRLQEWLNAGIESLPPHAGKEKPATLHITHSWGGGVAEWLKSFIATDDQNLHYQMRSEGPQTGQGYGQRISLYAGNELRCPIASWWLTPAIESITDTHGGYKQVFSEICSRYGIGRIFVSSLVGHSLDAFRSGLPTLQILHDHFPIWPLLSVNPQPYLQSGDVPNLGLALREHAKNREFRDKDAPAWVQIRAAYLDTIKEFKVKIAAPGQSVLELQNQLEPAFKALTVKVIPHGFPVMEDLQAILPRPRKDRRLRLVIPGRMQTGKGQLLLSRALPELAKYVQVYLLGSGKSGEEFFGIPGVDVIVEYKRDDLSSIMAGIGPDFAALLSIVPETFSFTLSELQQMQIPAIATRLGSFPSRIEHGKTGWLVDVDSQALVRQVADLCDSPELIETVRLNLRDTKTHALESMCKAYNTLCPIQSESPATLAAEAGLNQYQRAAVAYQLALTSNKTQALEKKARKSTEWATETDRQLKQYMGWVDHLETELLRLQDMVADRQADLQIVEAQHRLLESEHILLESHHQALETHKQQLEASIQQYAAHNESLEESVKHYQAHNQHLEASVKQTELSIQNLQSSVRQYEAHTQSLEAHVQHLESSYQQLESHYQQLESSNRELESNHRHLESNYRHLDSDYQGLSEQHALIIASMSWKITRPLRAGRRVARNFMLARAWNPVRWPLLLSQLIRTLSTQGVGGTIKRMQTTGAATVPEPRLVINPEAINIETPSSESSGVESTETESNGTVSIKAESTETESAEIESDGIESIQAKSIKTEPAETESRGTESTETESKETQSTDTEAIDAETIGDSRAPTAFPRTDQPKVSIIIPVYNKWAYTAACLCSLLEVKGKYTFEVIIVDDNSSDATAHHLALIEGLTHLRNEKNLGFVGSCNRGARHARGEYLVMLNNDTRVMDGWLDELIDTFEREPLAGLVGSRLVYPDGRLQESGGIIFNDGSGWNYGRDQDAENPKYHFLREVDYCSGACIALKTHYFHELGAFDERYSPAYYEDTDLAFRVRESGLKVFIQPLSVIIHYEGITSGTDTSSGTKKYQLINQEKFLDRWQKELPSQPSPVADPYHGAEIDHASQHRIKGRFLIIDATTPEPDKDSGSVRLTNLMQILRDMGYGVTFFADNRAYAGRYTTDLQKSGIEVLYGSWMESLNVFFRNRGSEFDYIFISRHYIAINYVSLIKRYCPKAHFIFDTVDLHYLREQRLAELEQSQTLKRTARQTRRSELRVIQAADASLVVSTVEKAVLQDDAPGEKVHVLSNIHTVHERDKDFSDRKDIFFVGGYQHPPNVDAVCWFVNDIWPLIHRQLPGLRFHIIGSKAPDRVRALNGNGVVFHGFVESIEPFLSGCRLAVAPLRYGAGIKGKVNMSMAHGQPVVATPAAVEGMFATHEKELLVAQDAESFANEVVRLYQDEDLWNRLSDASVKNVEEHFSIAAARESLTMLIDSF